jgi:3-deoxy-manno-octulosonate cytidylyltransferase (CMP-KDO synthetase)
MVDLDRSAPVNSVANPPTNPIVIIPARLASTRLPNKPLADIHGVPMIIHVWRRALEADVGPVLVAAGDEAIADAVISAGGKAVMTDPAHPSGSDRIFEALGLVDPDAQHDAIINLQGDLPTIDPDTVRNVTDLLSWDAVDIGTLAAVISDTKERSNPNVVKAIVAIPEKENRGRALYFTRVEASAGPGPLYHHIGLYAYRRAALARFVALPPGILEQRERLEQLRALEAGMRIDVALTNSAPLGVDTEADLKQVRKLLA